MLTKMKFAEVEKYHTVLNHMIQSNPLLISTEVWNRLSPEQQDAIKPPRPIGATVIWTLSMSSWTLHPVR